MPAVAFAPRRSYPAAMSLIVSGPVLFRPRKRPASPAGRSARMAGRPVA